MTVALEPLLTLEAELVTRATDPADVDSELVDTVIGTTLVELQQTVNNETPDGRVQATGWRLFLSGDVVLTGWDAVRIDGRLYEIDGDPWPVRHPLTGLVHHVEAGLRRTD